MLTARFRAWGRKAKNLGRFCRCGEAQQLVRHRLRFSQVTQTRFVRRTLHHAESETVTLIGWGARTEQGSARYFHDGLTLLLRRNFEPLGWFKNQTANDARMVPGIVRILYVAPDRSLDCDRNCFGEITNIDAFCIWVGHISSFGFGVLSLGV
jgi:hypothetical protein